MKSLNDMEELKRVQGSTFDEFSRRRLIETHNTILEVTARIQELQNEVHCMNDSRDFIDVESVRSGLSHVPSQPALFPPFRDPGGMLSRSVGMPSRKKWAAKDGTSGIVYLQIQRRLLQHLIRKGSIRGFPTCQNTHHRMF